MPFLSPELVLVSTVRKNICFLLGLFLGSVSQIVFKAIRKMAFWDFLLHGVGGKVGGCTHTSFFLWRLTFNKKNGIKF